MPPDAPMDAGVDAYEACYGLCTTGGFEEERAAWLTIPQLGYVTAVDMNNDGKLDLVASNNGLNVVLGNGDGSFAPATINGSLFAPAVADIDRDTHPDVLALATTVEYLRNHGDGTLEPAIDTGFAAAAFDVGDVTGDGIPDLVGGTTDLQVLAGDGHGGFAAPVANTTGGTTVLAAVLIGDLNRDGVPELIGVTATGAVRVVIGGVEIDSGVTTAPAIHMRPQLADLDGDGVLDLVVGTLVLKGDGLGHFATPIDVGATGQLFTADFNNDHHADLVVSSSTGTRILVGDGAGAFHEIDPTRSAVLGNATALAAADLDRDGPLDLIVSNTDITGVFRGIGDGSIDAIVKTDFVSGAPVISVASADFNNDTFDDIVSYSPQDGLAHVYLHGCTGFGRHDDYPVGKSNKLVLADINNDGLLDIVSGVTVLLAHPDGTFVAANNIAPRVDDFAVADVNGDHYLDVITLTNAAITVHLGHGNGGFTTSATLPSATSAFAIGDIDGDGRQDIVSEDVVELGNGDGTFHAGTPVAGLGSFTQAQLFDLDLDGQLDLITSDSVVTQIRYSVRGAPIAYPMGDFQIYDPTAHGRHDIYGHLGSYGVMVLFDEGNRGYIQQQLYGVAGSGLAFEGIDGVFLGNATGISFFPGSCSFI